MKDVYCVPLEVLKSTDLCFVETLYSILMTDYQFQVEVAVKVCKSKKKTHFNNYVLRSTLRVLTRTKKVLEECTPKTKYIGIVRYGAACWAHPSFIIYYSGKFYLSNENSISMQYALYEKAL